MNVSEVARECHVERNIAENYFSILDDSLLGVRLPVFHNRAQRKLVVHSKFFFFDTGVYRAIRPTGPLDSPGGATRQYFAVEASPHPKKGLAAADGLRTLAPAAEGRDSETLDAVRRSRTSVSDEMLKDMPGTRGVVLPRAPSTGG